MNARNPLTWRGLARPVCLAALLVAAGCTMNTAPVLSTGDQAEIGRIAGYLNAIPRFEAHFVQTGAMGAGAGLVWLDRPGHLRLDYEGPASRVMVVSGGRVRITDRSNGAVTTQPLSRTPLGILLTPTIQLDGPVTVDALRHSGDTVELTLSKTGAAAQGSLTLVLRDHPLALLAVSLTDPYRRILRLDLSGLDTAPVLTPDLFAAPGA